MNFNHLTKYSVAIVIVMFGLVTGACNAMAASESPQKILDKVSKEGRAAMRDVRWARVAIFDGQPKQATEMLEQAKKNLALVEKQAPEMVVSVQTKQQVGDKTIDEAKTTETSDLIPIDAGLALSEDFVATPERKEQIAKANEHLKKGETSKAIEVLHAADIGLSVTRVLMPVKATIMHVEKAIELLNDHKYYEANLSLKAAEEGQIVDTMLLFEPVASEKKAAEPAKK
jgi:glucan-binding YG repeat protein